MFRSLGRFVARTWPLWLLLWGALLAGGRWAAPGWDEVAEEGVFRFLPAEVPSHRAEELIRRAFSEGQSDSSIVIVASRADGPLRAEDEAFVRDRLVAGLGRIAADLGSHPEADPLASGRAPGGPERPRAESAAGGDGPEERAHPGIVRIRSLARGVERPVVISADGRSTVVHLELSTTFMDRSNREVVEPVRAFLDRLRREGAVPEGLAVALTGSAVVGHDINAREEVTARKIERWTIWWVLLLLLVVHRAPLLALVQMVTVFVAMQVALDLMALMARAGWIGLFESLDVYTTVLVYGAGIDYSLFLIARYRERLEAGESPREAMEGAIDRVGLAVTISAGTAIVAVGTLLFADFGMFSRAGFTIPFGLFVMLLTSLTLTPALLMMLRGAAVWPSRPGAARGEASADEGRLGRLSRGDPLAGVWRLLGGGLRRRPGAIWGFSLLAMAPLAVYGALKRDEVSYAPMSEIPGDSPSVRAVSALREHFPAGIAGPLTAVIRDDSADFSTEEGTELVGRLTGRLMERRDELGIASVRSVAEGFGEAMTPIEREAEEREARRDPGLGRAIGGLVLGAAESFIPGDPSEQAMRALRERAVSEYVGGLDRRGDVTRVVILPSYDPFSGEALDRVDAIREAVERSLPEGLSGAEVAIAGASASLRDLRNVTRGDRDRIFLLATVGVSVVLIVLLRRLAVSLYLIGTVLLNFLVTLGVTFLVFRLLEGAEYDGIDWTVPVFLFTLLMAIGADYNVFLLTRIDEERREHGPVGGVVEGLRRTGGIISGCGLIMAGTFGSLLWGGTLMSLYELGFALVFGVLLDTFFIRPLLVPSYLVLIHSGRLGRLGRLLGGRSDAAGRDQPVGAASE